MPLVEDGRIVEDRYLRVGDDAPIPDRVPVIVPAKRFLADADALIRRDGSLGVLWPNDRRVAELEPWLGHLALDRASISRNSATAAPIARRGCCASITAFAARCAPPATCCAISSTFWCAPGSIPSR